MNNNIEPKKEEINSPNIPPFKIVEEQPNYSLLFVNNDRKEGDLQSKIFISLFDKNFND